MSDYVVIEEWYIHRGLSTRGNRLCGKKNGMDIVTSYIIELNEEFVKTENSVYKLGKKSYVENAYVERCGKFYFIKKNGEAIHKCGDLTRDTYDAELIMIYEEDENYLIGNYIEGYGFTNVRFKKDDCRLATDDELFMCDCGRMEEIRF